MRHNRLLATALLGTALLAATEAHATFTVTIEQVGSDVSLTGSGSLHLAGLTSVGIESVSDTGINPSVNDLLGVVGSAAVYNGFFGPANFGSGGPHLASTSSGSTVGLFGAELFVPAGYTSGSPLSLSETFTGQTFASLGVTPGTYIWTWGTIEFHDSFVLEIATVPEPASLMLVGAGLAGIGVMCRRRRS